MVYSIIILGMMGVICGLNIAFNPLYAWYVYILATIGYVAAVILIDGLVAALIRHMPEKHFDYHKRVFTSTKRELKFYQRIGVSRWKKWVPELGMFTHFRKNKIANPRDPAYLARYILEACYGVIIHYWSVPTSFLILLLDIPMYTGPSNLWIFVAAPVALVNAVLILLPAFILKDNLPKLVWLYEKTRQREKKTAPSTQE